jgi:hypothetical protein
MVNRENLNVLETSLLSVRTEYLGAHDGSCFHRAGVGFSIG